MIEDILRGTLFDNMSLYQAACYAYAVVKEKGFAASANQLKAFKEMQEYHDDPESGTRDEATLRSALIGLIYTTPRGYIPYRFTAHDSSYMHTTAFLCALHFLQRNQGEESGHKLWCILKDLLGIKAPDRLPVCTGHQQILEWPTEIKEHIRLPPINGRPILAYYQRDMAWPRNSELLANGGAAGNMALVAYEREEWDRLPILADALEEAGSCDQALLDHLRSGEQHWRGCWAVDACLRLAKPVFRSDDIRQYGMVTYITDR